MIPPPFPRFPPVPPAPAQLLPPTAAPLEDRRGTVNRVESMTGRTQTVEGSFVLEGAGEGSVEVRFPVWFIEKPNFSAGGELGEGNSPTATKYPTLSVIVLRWIVTDYGNNVRYYSGAILGAVSIGVLGQEMIAHFRFEGRALRNPANDSAGDVDGTI